MATRQRDISVSEFFTKNRHLLGFDNPAKALLTTVKEAVDNSLDACEEAGILPDLLIEVREIAEGRIYTGRKAKELKLVDELGGFDDAVAAAWQMAGQSGEPKLQYPPREHELSLRDLMRGAFQGAFQGAAEGATQGARADSGLMLLAPALVGH